MTDNHSDRSSFDASSTASRTTRRKGGAKRGSRAKGKGAGRKAVPDSATMFGGGLLAEVERSLHQSPMPLKKKQRVEKCMPDVEQVLNAYPDISPKRIIQILATLDNEAVGPTFTRLMTSAIKALQEDIRSQIDSESGNTRSKSRTSSQAVMPSRGLSNRSTTKSTAVGSPASNNGPGNATPSLFDGNPGAHQ